MFTVSRDGSYRIEGYSSVGDPARAVQRLVEAATGAVVFDTAVLVSDTLMEFDEAGLAVLYTLYRDDAMAFRIYPKHRLYQAFNDRGWFRLSEFPAREQSRAAWLDKRGVPKHSNLPDLLASASGKSILTSPGEVGPGTPFPLVRLPGEYTPQTSTFSEDGRYRIDLMLYPSGNPFGDPPEEVNRLVEVASGITIFEGDEVTGYVTLAFGAGGLVKIHAPGWSGTDGRNYLLDPARRCYARETAPEDWTPLTSLRDEEHAIWQSHTHRLTATVSSRWRRWLDALLTALRI